MSTRSVRKVKSVSPMEMMMVFGYGLLMVLDKVNWNVLGAGLKTVLLSRVRVLSLNVPTLITSLNTRWTVLAYARSMLNCVRKGGWSSLTRLLTS